MKKICAEIREVAITITSSHHLVAVLEHSRVWSFEDVNSIHTWICACLLLTVAYSDGDVGDLSPGSWI